MSGDERLEPAVEDGAARCPICRRPTHAAYRPFCSPRCADVDLNRWLGGVYSIPVADGDPDDEPSDGGSPG